MAGMTCSIFFSQLGFMTHLAGAICCLCVCVNRCLVCNSCTSFASLHNNIHLFYCPSPSNLFLSALLETCFCFLVFLKCSLMKNKNIRSAAYIYCKLRDTKQFRSFSSLSIIHLLLSVF